MSDPSTLTDAMLEVFAGRVDCYGQGDGCCVKEPLTPEVMARHLAGKGAVGIYPVTADNRCRWVCVDLDLPGEPDLAQWAKALGLAEAFQRLSCSPFIERSKSKGFHVWVFFRDAVEAAWGRQVAAKALADAGLPADTEVFPKQDRVDDATPFGNYVNLPYHGPNGNGRRVMLDPTTGKPWTVAEFLDALSLTDPNDVLLARDSKPEKDGLIVGGGDAARLLGEDAPYGNRHEKGKRVIGLLVARLWADGEQAVLDAAQCWNTAHCGPPLPEAEVGRMVRDFWRKEEAKRAKEGVQDSTPESPLKELTAAQLLASGGESAAVEFLPLLGKEGFIIQGWSHILASYPKTGKTELLADAVAKWTALGLRVLYFTEEPEAVWRLRLQVRPPAVPENFTLVFALLAGVEAVEARIRAGTEQAVIVDTTRNVLGMEDEKDNSAIARAIGPLISACRPGDKTLVLAHHHVKAGGEHGRGIAGGHAFLGIVDVALEIVREQKPNRRRLEGQGRIVTIPALLYEMAENGTLTALGSPSDVSADEVRERVWEALTADWQPTAKIREALGEPQPAVNSVLYALRELAERGDAERDPPMSEGGKAGKAYKWRALT